MKKITILLRSRRGEAMIGQAAVLLTAVLVISLIITVGSFLNKKSDLDYIANEVARYVEIKGDTAAAHTEFNRLSGVMQIPDADMHIDAATIGGTTKIQLEEAFTVTVSASVDIGAGGILKLSVPVRSKATGRSEKYWK